MKKKDPQETATAAETAPHAAPKTEDNSVTSPLAELVVRVLDAHKGMNIEHYSVRGISSEFDDVIICTATSTPHVKALQMHVEKEISEKLQKRVRAHEGKPETGWLLLDLGDVIVHIFTDAVRKIYALEHLWPEKKCLDTLALIRAKLAQMTPSTSKRVTAASLAGLSTPTEPAPAKKSAAAKKTPAKKAAAEKKAPAKKTVSAKKAPATAKKTAAVKKPAAKKTTSAKKKISK